MRVYSIVLLAILAAPVAAQEASPGRPVTAEEAIANAKEVYGPPDTRAKETCPPHRAGAEIVVCAEIEEQGQFRVQSSGDLDPAGAGARGGVPRAPDVGTSYPGAVVARGCFIPPGPPPMPKIIDLKVIPEAPPGSDADRVARGLAPRGTAGTIEPPDLPPPAADAAPADRPVRLPG